VSTFPVTRETGPGRSTELVDEIKRVRPAIKSIRVLTSDKEATMAIARVVSFEEVGSDRVEQLTRELRDGQQPEDVPATEIVMLHDPDGDQSLVILFFENEDDYRRADEALNAMPADDTPGRRTSVTKYNVAIRVTA
jgi:hypothetical protein